MFAILLSYLNLDSIKSDWECTFSFISDKVFGPDSITEAVYEEGVKNVALSSLMGINGNSLPPTLKGSFYMNISSFWKPFDHRLISILCISATIFAYGQTSSGKTYTMRGITEKAVNDIYSHIMSVSFIILEQLLLSSDTSWCQNFPRSLKTRHKWDYWN